MATHQGRVIRKASCTTTIHNTLLHSTDVYMHPQGKCYIFGLGTPGTSNWKSYALDSSALTTGMRQVPKLYAQYSFAEYDDDDDSCYEILTKLRNKTTDIFQRTRNPLVYNSLKDYALDFCILQHHGFEVSLYCGTEEYVTRPTSVSSTHVWNKPIYKTKTVNIKTHNTMCNSTKPSYAAILLSGASPQKVQFKYQEPSYLSIYPIKRNFIKYNIENVKLNSQFKAIKITQLPKPQRATNNTQAPLVLQAQMDIPPTTATEQGNEMEAVSTEAVTLLENRQTTETGPVTTPIQSNSFGLQPHVYKEMTERFNNLGTFTWSTSHAIGTIIKTFDLPLDALTVLANNPTTLPFTQYMFFKPNLTLRFQLNSTRFHAGKLVIGFRYYNKFSTSIAELQHAAQIVQLDYVSLFAASSNIADLKIPFQSHML